MPTQVFTEYVRHVLGGSGDPVQGIRYRSAMRPEGASWVLFLDHTACTDASSGWKCNPEHWLGLLPSSLQHFEAMPGVPGWRAIP